MAVPIVYVVAWVLIWMEESQTEDWLFEPGNFIWQPAVVAIQLGFGAVATFIALYSLETNEESRVRSAITGMFVVLYVFLLVDVLTIPGLRDIANAGEAIIGDEENILLTGSFLASALRTLTWTVGIIVGFHFASTAAENVTKKIQAAETKRLKMQIQADQEQQTQANRS
ncbi:MAG TPA: hypothetical protein VMS99_16625 [Acidimicrobiia bacterium]|nr:hypothetical protein [Acidimicrobiia bacterium]